MLRRVVLLLGILLGGGAALANPVSRDQFITLARAGWSYELRTTMRRPGSAAIVPQLHARNMISATLCLLGEAPSAATLATLTSLRRLLAGVFDTAPRLVRAGRPADCDADSTIFLRLYSTRDPTSALNGDINYLNRRFDIGLSRAAQFPTSPGQAQTFFGRAGMVTHILVMQDGPRPVPEEHRRFFTGLLIEELYQSLSFGMDVLHLDRTRPLVSKLEEVPVRAHFLPWRSAEFIAEMARGGTAGLCAFDVFMLVALAQSDLPRSNDPVFIDELTHRFGQIRDRAAALLQRPDLATLFDPACKSLPD